MSDRQSLVNVTLKIRTKFHGTPFLKNLVSRKTRLKVSERHFSYVSFTYFFLFIYRGLQFLQFATKSNPSPLIFDSPKVMFESHDLHFIIMLKVVNSDTNSIILYPRIYYYTPKVNRFKR